ncbi:hypothetical protein [Haloarcula brevis]|uniref:hypothetical protein n=1 Tax=Haloarcula brevis TaxID=3111453 RepID=UPI00300F0C3E
MSDDERDPFEELDPDGDREGDPFERLGGPGDADSAETEPDSSAGADASGTPEMPEADVPGADDNLLSAVDTEEFRSAAESDSSADADRSVTESPAETDDPFSGMDDRGEDPFGSGESAFERVDIDHIDADKVWAEIAEGDDGGTAPEGRYAEVSKHRYCEQCEHFSEPPNAHCTNEGTELMEFLDMETVRLLDCPVVAENHDIEGEQ